MTLPPDDIFPFLEVWYKQIHEEGNDGQRRYLTTEQFLQLAEKFDCTIEKNYDSYWVIDNISEEYVGFVARDTQFNMEIYARIKNFSGTIFEIMTDYARTPLDLREDDDYYILGHRNTGQFLSRTRKWVDIFSGEFDNPPSHILFSEKELKLLGFWEDNPHYIKHLR